MSEILYTKTHNGLTINILDTYECEYTENYANEGRTEYTIQAAGVAEVTFETTRIWNMANPYISRNGGNTINQSYPWPHALYFDTTDYLTLKIYNQDLVNNLIEGSRMGYIPYCEGNWKTSGGTNKICSFSTNIPIFETEEEAEAYCEEESASERQRMIRESAVNYKRPEFDTETKRYFIIAEYETVNVYKGNVTVASGSTKTYRTTMFDSNTMPALYFVNDGADFILGLNAPDVVAGYSLPSPVSVFEQVPETSWNEYTIGYSGTYYTDMNKLIGSDYDYPEDGSYSYATYFYTNIPILKNEQAAEDAIDSGDYSEACNWDNVSGGVVREPDFGVKETATTFGDGTFSSPFVAQYVMSGSDVRNVSSIFFDDDQGLIDDIKKGLELFGAKPVDAIMSLVAFPFDVTTVVNCSPFNYIYFGSYRHTLQSSVNRVMNCLANYLDAGTIYLAPLFGSYRDYKNINLSIYLPFIGWRDLEIEKYIKKTINVRYYVDINTRQCAAVLVADSIMADYFVGEIGIELPIVGSNFADYARSEIQHIGNTAKSMMNPFSGGALSNLGNAATLGGGLEIGPLSTSFNNSTLAKNYSQYKFGQNGSPKDIQMTKGSFSSGVGMYLPQYVMFRFDVHDIVEPALLNELCGKPSTASGKISQFSGFLSGRVSKLVTTGMTDSEIQEVQNAIMNDGIYI